MKRFVFLVFFTLIFVNAHFVYAQLGKKGPKFYSEFKPVVGAWSKYKITAKGEPSSKMRIAIVGKEADAYWYETVMEVEGEEKVITKMLVSGNPEDQKNVKRMVVKMGNEPAMEMPVGMTGHPQKVQGKPGKVIDKGMETIRVPAGTFNVKHLQYQDPDAVVDAWIHKDVSPYGIVKSQSKEFEMILLGYGTGAKSLITETPEKFEFPQLPQMPQIPGIPRRK